MEIEQYIIDSEREYVNLCKELDGVLLKIGPSSNTYINILYHFYLYFLLLIRLLQAILEILFVDLNHIALKTNSIIFLLHLPL